MAAMELLAVQDRTAPELASALAIHVRTARRMLKRLEADGYVAVSRDGRRRYRPTMRIVALAGQVVARADLTQLARPYVTQLRDKFGYDCHLCVPSYWFALCLVHAGKDHGGGRPHLRELVPCHCTAAGKALLAWREPWRETVLERPLETYTDRTRTGPSALRREFGHIRARGYAIEDREYQPDTRALAAPVRYEKDTMAALGARAGPPPRRARMNKRAVIYLRTTSASSATRGSSTRATTGRSSTKTPSTECNTSSGHMPSPGTSVASTTTG